MKLYRRSAAPVPQPPLEKKTMMIHRRFDSAANDPRLVSWEADYANRMNPELVTSLFWENVPLTEFVQWRVTRVEPGLAESVLPLNTAATNQHFTHHASMFLLAADNTGGIAIASLLRGWPVVGLNPVPVPRSMALWTLKSEIRYLRPSVGDLHVVSRVDPARHARIQRRFLDGKPVIETLDVDFFNDDAKVGEATLTYFARQSDALRTAGLNSEKVNLLYELKLTSSAELIAGVRAQESGKLFHDPYAANMAGKHGMALAKRFCARSPQLGGMVAARTRHLDSAIEKFVASGGRDLVLLGVGWDMRPFRMQFPKGMRIFELDLPSTLAERSRRLKDLHIEDPAGVARWEIPVDLRTMPLADLLGLQIDPNFPVFIAWEGMSMYFREEEVAAVLRGMEPLMTHPASRIWFDLVERKAIECVDLLPESVQAFMRGMQMLGEPFTFGTDHPEAFLENQGLACQEHVASNVFLENDDDAVYALYRFCVISGRKCAQRNSQSIRSDAGAATPQPPHRLASPIADPSAT